MLDSSNLQITLSTELASEFVLMEILMKGIGRMASWMEMADVFLVMTAVTILEHINQVAMLKV